MKYSIELLIFNQLNNWLSNIYFFFDVKNIINDFLKNSDYDIYFDGNNIIFNNEIPIYYNNEIGTYISNEYYYDDINNIVYRIKDDSINNEIDNWINNKNIKTFYGVHIHKLLRKLRELGDELIKLMKEFSNPLVDSPNYLYNNPLKFIINKIWEKYNLQNLNKDFNDNLVITNYTNIMSSLYSSINYLQNQTIVYYGLNSQYIYNQFTTSNFNESTIDYLTIDNYKPIIIQNKLITIPIFKYQINFNNNVISPNSNYYINFAYDYLPITKYEIYPNQINFELIYDINSTDFIIIEKEDKYKITNNKNLGWLYELKIKDINYKLIENIYNKNNKLYIESINDTFINVISNNNITNDFEIINNTTVKNITFRDDKYYLDFYIETFNYSSGKTLLKSNNNIYILNKDTTYYINEMITDFNVEIIIMVSGTFINKKIYIYQYYTDLILNDSMNIIPFNFSINNIVANNIKINSDNILFYTNTEINETIYNIQYKQQIGFINMNKIIDIKEQDEYLYYFNYSLPSTINTTIYLYDTEDDVYNEEKNTKKSIYIKFYNNQTYFTIDKLYTNKKFIQINSWTIINYKLNGTNIELSLPLDFIFNSSNKYYYKVNNVIVDKSTFIIFNNLIIIKWTNKLPDNIIFKQYYIETENNKILIPDNNRKINIKYEIPYQYSDTNNYLILPYTNIGTRFYKYLYKIYINEDIDSDIINILLNGNNIIGLVFNKLQNNCYIISLKNKINTTYKYSYYIDDLIIKNINNITYYQDTLEYGDFYYQDKIDEINLFMKDNITTYNFNNNQNRFYLINYIKYDITNLYYPNKFIQNQNMKQINNYEYKKLITIEKPILTDYKKIFSYIKLFLNDQLLEELNEDTFNIHRLLYCTEEKRKQLDKLTQIRFINNHWEIYIPFHFWYCNRQSKSIPTISLPYSDLRLFYKLNELSYVLENDLSGKYKTSIKPSVRVELITDFILLEMEERKLFGSYSHEYIIERYKIYNKSYVNTKTTILKNNFSGLIKDIHLIVKLIKNPKINCYQEIINDFDYRYNDYIIALSYYKLYIINNVYTSIEQKNYSREIDIIKNNLIELSIGSVRINRLILNIKSWKYYNNDFLKFLMYYEDKYLQELNDNRKNYVINMYIKYLYKNKTNIKETSLIDSLLLKINGTELFAERKATYFTNLIPTQKFKNSLPTGYYSYTFSLYPLEEQYSGHLNFTHFDDTIIKITSNDLVSSNPYMINTIVKEYNILRIMSGIGSLAWID